MQFEFKELGGSRCIRVAPALLGVEISADNGFDEEFIFMLDPNDFGDFAAAIWKCSPDRHRRPVMITTEDTGKGNHEELGIAKDTREDGADNGQSCREETKGDSAGQETPNTGNVQDSCTDRGSEKGSPQGS